MSAKGEVSRVYRGLRRRVNRGKPLDSFPFLSGDSYFYSCQFYFESGTIRKVSSKPGRRQRDKSLFVKMRELDSFFLFLEENKDKSYSDFMLVLHNGDDSISEDFLRTLKIRFRKILAVNLIKDSRESSAIPIGLENRNYFTNGIPGDFEKLITSGLKPSENRPTLLLEAFSLHTNRPERETCSDIASQLGSTKLHRDAPVEYRRALSESRFVLSPAGNGFDCHRTWEAMYLGAIPILRRVHWPFIKQSLPVLIVDEWEDLLGLDLNAISMPRNLTWSEDFWHSFYND